MAKKKKDDPDTEVDESLQDAPEPEVVHYDPDVFVCLGDGVYIEHGGAKTRERRLNISGTNFEHVSEDADGVWVYRAM